MFVFGMIYIWIMIMMIDDNSSFSNLFFLNKIDKGIYFADDIVLFSFELTKVANDFDEFIDNIENLNLFFSSK